MNMLSSRTPDDHKAFQLLSEMADEQPVSQRELAKRLGIALGLVNSYLKNFVAKGYIRIKNYPQNRYAYLLTPTGMAEKARLAYQHVNYFTSLYTVTRDEYRALFQSLLEQNVTVVCFCGVDEVAEIAWLSLQESGIRLARVFDDHQAGSFFMGLPVEPMTAASPMDRIIVTSVKRRDAIISDLQKKGIDVDHHYFPALSGATGGKSRAM